MSPAGPQHNDEVAADASVHREWAPGHGLAPPVLEPRRKEGAGVAVAHSDGDGDGDDLVAAQLA